MPRVARSSVGEAVRRPGDGADRLGGELGGGGARSRWRGKTGRKGERGQRRLLWRPGGAGGEEKGGRGVRVSTLGGGENRGERGPRARWGTARVAGIGPRPAGMGGAIAAQQGRE
jgi:hypothetical protein